MTEQSSRPLTFSASLIIFGTSVISFRIGLMLPREPEWGQLIELRSFQRTVMQESLTDSEV